MHHILVVNPCHITFFIGTWIIPNGCFFHRRVPRSLTKRWWPRLFDFSFSFVEFLGHFLQVVYLFYLFLGKFVIIFDFILSTAKLIILQRYFTIDFTQFLTNIFVSFFFLRRNQLTKHNFINKRLRNFMCLCLTMVIFFDHISEGKLFLFGFLQSFDLWLLWFFCLFQFLFFCSLQQSIYRIVCFWLGYFWCLFSLTLLLQWLFIGLKIFAGLDFCQLWRSFFFFSLIYLLVWTFILSFYYYLWFFLVFELT